MEFITSFASNYYIVLLIIGGFVLFALIGYITSKIKDRGMRKLGSEMSVLDANDFEDNKEDIDDGVSLITSDDK